MSELPGKLYLKRQDTLLITLHFQSLMEATQQSLENVLFFSSFKRLNINEFRRKRN